jgi:hypothetical protein
LVEKRCPLRVPRHTRAGCCTWDTFITSFADAFASHRVIAAADLSAREKRAVKLSEIPVQ